jgi:hypothetical protein
MYFISKLKKNTLESRLNLNIFSGKANRMKYKKDFQEVLFNPQNRAISCSKNGALRGALMKNPKFFLIFDLKTLKIRHPEKIFDSYFCFLSAIVIQAWHSKVKTITSLHKTVCIL